MYNMYQMYYTDIIDYGYIISHHNTSAYTEARKQEIHSASQAGSVGVGELGSKMLHPVDPPIS